MTAPDQPVVVLGGGINGAAIARELLLNKIPVLLVDTADIAFGTTAYSSRLIHGGLRYLEYGEFSLVRESLEERKRLLELAPQFVQPLKILIPTGRRLGGWWASVRRLLGGQTTSSAARGLWLIRCGLRMYDLYARDPKLSGYTVQRIDDPTVPAVDPQRFRWLCGYWDAQILFPERFVLALLDDARALAGRFGMRFEVFTYHRARLDGRRLQLHAVADGPVVAESWEPAAIVNATGAWVDRTLQALDIPSRRLIGGTKGSHFVTFHRPLRTQLGGQALYTEADDGRPVFVLPLGDAVLVGTTDLKYDEDPSTAVMTDPELDYLIGVVHRLFPQIGLTKADVHMHYAGVRPLPYSEKGAAGAITRRHWLQEDRECDVPLYSVVGGKLTTCRSLAEEVVETVAGWLGRTVTVNSRDRMIPGAQSCPTDREQLRILWQELAQRYGLDQRVIRTVWSLYGSRCTLALDAMDPQARQCLPGCDLPEAVARWSIDHEWVTCLQDLVERRLMLLYQQRLTRQCLEQLARMLIDARKLAPEDADREIASTIERLRTHYSLQIADLA
jgi:glycerol-3-phosphate dehydrogenase